MSADLSLRRMIRADIPCVRELINDAFRSESLGDEVVSLELEPYFDRRLHELELNAQREMVPRECYVAEHASHGVVGITGLYQLVWTWSPPNRLAFLGWTAVASAHQGHGIGTWMLQGMIALARARGIAQILVEALRGSRAVSWYIKNGFAQVAEIPHYWGPGADATILALPLDHAALTARP